MTTNGRDSTCSQQQQQQEQQQYSLITSPWLGDSVRRHTRLSKLTIAKAVEQVTKLILVELPQRNIGTQTTIDALRSRTNSSVKASSCCTSSGGRGDSASRVRPDYYFSLALPIHLPYLYPPTCSQSPDPASTEAIASSCISISSRTSSEHSSLWPCALQTSFRYGIDV